MRPAGRTNRPRERLLRLITERALCGPKAERRERVVGNGQQERRLHIPGGETTSFSGLRVSINAQKATQSNCQPKRRRKRKGNRNTGE